MRLVAWAAIPTLAFLAWLVPAAFAQPPCGGDCSLDEQVTVDEILTLVNIGLGSGTTSDCLAGDLNGDDEITVDEILTAVNNALAGCSPRLTETWLESGFAVVTSTCPVEIADAIGQEVGGQGDCETELTFIGDTVTGVDCMGNAVEGSTGVDGVSRFTQSTVDSVAQCEIRIAIELQVDLRTSPTTGSYLAAVDLTGMCPFGGCAVVVQSTWERLP